MTWPTKKLGEICDFIFGYSFPASLFNKESSGLSVIKTGDIKNNFCENFYDGNYDKRYIVKPKDILIGLSGTIISGCWQGKIALLNQRVVKLDNFSSGIDKNFVFYVLPVTLKEFEQTLWKAAVKNVLKHHLENLEIPLPPLPKQKRIVYVLDAIQEAVRGQEKVLEKTKELKGSLMHKFFREGTQGEKLKKTEIGKMPESWKVKELKEVVEKSVQVNPKEWPNKRIKYIDVSSISSKFLKIVDFKEYYGKNVPSRARKKIKINDIIFATVRPSLRRLALVPIEFDGEICSTAFCVIRTNNKKVDPIFLFNYVTSNDFINRVTSLQAGANYPAVSDKQIFRQKIPVTSLKEQRKIAEILQTVDQKIEVEQKKKTLYEELFRAMLNKLMNGEIRTDNLRI